MCVASNLHWTTSCLELASLDREDSYSLSVGIVPFDTRISRQRIYLLAEALRMRV